MDFRNCIIDELGYFIDWCSEYTDDELNDKMQQHPEWSISCMEIQIY